MKLVEERTGVGELIWRGRTYPEIAYTLRRFQAMTAAGLPVPGLHRIEGRLELHSVAAGGALGEADVALRLEDGRTVNLTVVDAEGRVLAEGHGPAKCTCC